MSNDDMTSRTSPLDPHSNRNNVDTEESTSHSNLSNESHSTTDRDSNDPVALAESPTYTPLELQGSENVARYGLPNSPTYTPNEVPGLESATHNVLPGSQTYTPTDVQQFESDRRLEVHDSVNTSHNVVDIAQTSAGISSSAESQSDRHILPRSTVRSTSNNRNDEVITNEPEDAVIVNVNILNNNRLETNVNESAAEVNEVMRDDGSNDAPISNIDEDSVGSTSNLPRVRLRSSPDSNTLGVSLRGRRKSDPPSKEPPAKVRKVESEETDYDSCPICLEPYQSSGDHRIASLKCGHIFGHNCLERWLKALPLKARSCPTCKGKATMRDIRYIYARRLVMEDSDRVTKVLEENAKLQMEKNKIELELEKTKIACRAAQLETEMLRKMLMKNQNSAEPVRKQWRFALEKNLQICREGGCRVLTYNCRTYELYVSQKNMNYLFPGYGIRKVSCVDYELGQFVHLHRKPIRDITYSQPRDLLLSVGLDGAARIVERGIPNITIDAGMPLWSCSWDYMRTNEFYVGGVGGVIHQYDFRNPSTYIQSMRNTSDVSPVASLCSTEYGLLSCQLNSSWLWVANQRQWEPRSLPVDGWFMSLSYDNESHRAVVCTRPNTSTQEKAKLTLCKLKSVQGEIAVDIEETFNGTSRSSLMSRAAWVKVPGASWIAAHSESDSALFLHGLDGARTLSLHAAEPAIDVCPAQVNGNTLLAALSESRLRIYKAVSSS